MKVRITTITVLVLLLPLTFFAQERFRRIPPRPEPLPQLDLPEIESTTLTNGLKVSVLFRTGIPKISLRLIILNGESSSPDAFPGLASFTAEMLTRATINHSFLGMEEIIDSIGGSFTTETTPDFTIFSFSFIEEYLDEALALLGDILLKPSFSRQDIAATKTNMYHKLVRGIDDPIQNGKKLLFQILFKDHVYQKFLFHEDGIKNFTQKNIRMFFNKFYRPNNARLVVVGNLNLSTASRKVSRYLNTWQRQSLETYQFQFPEPNPGTRVHFIDLPRAKEATVFIGNVLPPKTDDIYFPFTVLNQVLGGSHLSRLFLNLRETKGYAYWAYSSMDFYKSCGIFYIRARVRPQVLFPAIMECLSELKRISLQKISNAEIEQAKSYLIGNYPLILNTYEKLAARAAEIQALELDTGFWDKYFQSIMRVDTQMVLESIQKVPLVNPVVIIAGSLEALDEHLREFEEIEIYNSKRKFLYKITKEKNNAAH